MTPEEYESVAIEGLQIIFPDCEVVGQWKPFAGETDKYAPKPDVAVGPFAINRRYGYEYANILRDKQDFIESLVSAHNENLERFAKDFEPATFEQTIESNFNARCLLCIEFENKTSSKHILGALVNASGLGRIGVLVAWSPRKLKLMIKQRQYLKFLRDVEKNSFYTNNVLILSKEQFDVALQQK